MFYKLLGPNGFDTCQHRVSWFQGDPHMLGVMVAACCKEYVRFQELQETRFREGQLFGNCCWVVRVSES